ncbi:MAG: ParB/RepB/Spo0J family partition protein [Evtepia sp.]
MSSERAGKGLGRGLGALLGDAALQTQETGSLSLPISQVEPGLNQPRKHFDQEALAELAESIRLHGIIQPLTVRRLSSGYYQIIAGERRWRAARIAGLNHVPAVVIDADDRKVMEIALIENLQRADLNPMEEAAGYRALMDEYGLTQEEAAVCVGKSRPSITNTLRLLALPTEVKWLLEQGTISAGHGRALLSLSDSELQIELANRIVHSGMSVRETETAVKRMAKGILAPEAKEIGMEKIYLKEAACHLSEYYGRKVKISYQKRKGKIELEYYDKEDLETLLQILEERGKERGL